MADYLNNPPEPFAAACRLAKIEPTTRQLRKWKAGKGLARIFAAAVPHELAYIQSRNRLIEAKEAATEAQNKAKSRNLALEAAKKAHQENLAANDNDAEMTADTAAAVSDANDAVLKALFDARQASSHELNAQGLYDIESAPYLFALPNKRFS